MKILVTDLIATQGLDLLRDRGWEVSLKPGIPAEELVQIIGQYDGLIIRSGTKVTAEVIAATEHLKVIGRAGAGIDNVDIEAATKKGVLVMNTPGGNSVSVAEHTLGLILSLMRHLTQADKTLKEGKWEKNRYTGRELRGKVLGLVGLGKVGQEVARSARSLGMKVIASDPFISERMAQDLDVKLTTLDHLYSTADVISLHASLNESTKGMINQDSLARMKDGVVVINCSRGELIDEEALLDAIESRKVSGAGIDVFANEPNPNPKLVTHPRVVATPHIAASTQEAQENVGVEIAEQVGNYLETGEIRNAVNFPSIPPEQASRLGIFLQLGSKLGWLASQVATVRPNEIGIRYYGELVGINTYPITNAILAGILEPMLGEGVNIINARRIVEERHLVVIETRSSRNRTFSNLISIQLRDGQGGISWVEGAVMHEDHLRLVTVDGLDLDVPFSPYMLVFRNQDVPGVIGRIGTILGNAQVNIASFALGRRPNEAEAIGVLTVDSVIGESVLEEIRRSVGITDVRFVTLN